MESTATLDLIDPAVRGVLDDDDCLRPWERLRSRGPATPIAERLRVSPHAMHTHCTRPFREPGIVRASALHRVALNPSLGGGKQTVDHASETESTK